MSYPLSLESLSLLTSQNIDCTLIIVTAEHQSKYCFTDVEMVLLQVTAVTAVTVTVTVTAVTVTTVAATKD